MNQKNSVEIFEEGYRNFDLWKRKSVEGEFLDKLPRGQRRKLQLYKESRKIKIESCAD